MNGLTLIVVGAVVLALGIIIGIYGLIYEMTSAKKIKKQIKNEYLL